MSSSNSNSSLSIETQERIAEELIRFSRALKNEEHPAIDDYLEEFEGAERAELLRELIVTEIEHFSKSGDLVSFREYRERYPDDADVLDRAELEFRNQPTRPDLSSVPLKPGEHLHYVGDYELLEEIGRGGMGIVYRARQRSLGRIVAVKMLLNQFATQAEVARFEREAKLAAMPQHPTIVAVHEVGRHEGYPYFSMDYVDGESLAQMVREHLLSPKDAARYVQMAAAAVDRAHDAGILHRDLKPSNILIDQNDQVRITDFGLAKQVDSGETLTESGGILGTASYMPPEQAEGNRAKTSQASDVYALGAVLYELLTGRPPFRGTTRAHTIYQVIHEQPVPPRQFDPRIPRDLETICMKCLEKEPSDRIATAAFLADELGRHQKGEPIQSGRTPLPVRAWKWYRRNVKTANVLVALSVLVVLSALSIGFAWRIIQTFQPKAVATTAQTAVAYYDWTPRKRYTYELSIRNDRGEDRRTIELEVAGDDPVLHRIRKEERRGTGFVVDSDGYLVTCAQVVEDAVEVTVEVNQQVYPGTVVAFDRARDLAIVKIHAKNLPSIHLADSASVESTAEVLLIGFPTKNSLESGAMAQRAVVSSVHPQAHDRPFSIDRRIEKGWSGGPILNGRGDVVGIVSECLTRRSGSASTSVVIPSNSVNAFLKDYGVPIKGKGRGSEKDGKIAELTHTAHSATAIIRIKTGPDGIGSSERVALRYKSDLGAPTFGRFAIDRMGNMVHAENQPELPHQLGKILDLLLPPLPHAGLTRWEQTRTEEIPVQQVDMTRKTETSLIPDEQISSRFPGIRGNRPGMSPYSRWSFDPRYPASFVPHPQSSLRSPIDRIDPLGGLPPEVRWHLRPELQRGLGPTYPWHDDVPPEIRVEKITSTRQIKATRRTIYVLKKTTPTQITIHRSETLTTNDDVQGHPTIQLKSEGDIEFDRQLGVPVKFHAIARLDDRSQGARKVKRREISLELDLQED